MLVIGMAGRAGAGKDTAVGVARGFLEGAGFVVYDLAFADPLKRMYKSFFEGDPYTEDREIKENLLVPRTGGRTMRYILQALGTGFGRDLIDPNLWNMDMVHRVKLIRGEHLRHFKDDSNLAILIRDIRFPDEVMLTHSLGDELTSRVIDISRFEPKPLKWYQRWVRRLLRRGPHVSETAQYRQKLDPQRDVDITNDGTLRAFKMTTLFYTTLILNDYRKKFPETHAMSEQSTTSVTPEGKVVVKNGNGTVIFETPAGQESGHAWHAKDIPTPPDPIPGDPSVLGSTEYFPVMGKQVRLSDKTLNTLESKGFSRQMIVEAALGLLRFEQICHVLAAKGGWWTDLETGEPLDRNVGDLMSLINTEMGEAYDAYRKGINDDHLPERKGFDTEIGDMLIRTMDMCGGLGLETVEAIFEKLAYNITRADHQIENRRKDGGKKL